MGTAKWKAVKIFQTNTNFDVSWAVKVGKGWRHIYEIYAGNCVRSLTLSQPSTGVLFFNSSFFSIGVLFFLTPAFFPPTKLDVLGYHYCSPLPSINLSPLVSVSSPPSATGHQHHPTHSRLAFMSLSFSTQKGWREGEGRLIRDSFDDLEEAHDSEHAQDLDGPDDAQILRRHHIRSSVRAHLPYSGGIKE